MLPLPVFGLGLLVPLDLPSRGGQVVPVVLRGPAVAQKADGVDWPRGRMARMALFQRVPVFVVFTAQRVPFVRVSVPLKRAGRGAPLGVSRLQPGGGCGEGGRSAVQAVPRLLMATVEVLLCVGALFKSEHGVGSG